MLKIEATSKKPPQKLIGQLKAYFGDGGLGLKLVDDSAGCLSFEGGGGHVAATLCSDHDPTRVIRSLFSVILKSHLESQAT